MVIATVTHYWKVSLGLPRCSGLGWKTQSPMDKTSGQGNLKTDTHRWVPVMGTPHHPEMFWPSWTPLFYPSTVHHSAPPAPPPTPPPFPSAQRQVKAQMEQTSESKLGVRRPWLGRIQSNLPPVSRLAFDYVDDKDCKQNSLSLLISSLRRTLNIFNYAVWKAAVTQSGWWVSALLSLPTWTKYFLVFSASHT